MINFDFDKKPQKSYALIITSFTKLPTPPIALLLISGLATFVLAYTLIYLMQLLYIRPMAETYTISTTFGILV